MEERGDLLGRIVAGKYAVQSVIGQGAMGVVYRAKQVALDKVVALKVLSDDVRDDPEFVLRFHTEARAASRLDHPNSTRVLDFGDDDGLLYIAMELLDGQTLSELIARNFPLPPARVASIMSQTLSAVGAAHALKILHRDLKPENIIILQGRDDEDRVVDVVKVCDFGIAKFDGLNEPSDDTPRVTNPNDLSSLAWGKLKNATRAGVIIGTPQYMSPEQARGEELDDRSDLYSLGVVLFEVLTGRAPFDEGTPAEVLFKHSAVAAPKPSSIFAGADPDLEMICLRALSKDRDARFASAREMRLALRALLGDSQIVLPAPTPSVPRVLVPDTSTPTISATALVTLPKKRTSRAWWVAGIVAAGIAVFAIGAREQKIRRAHASEAAQLPQPPAPTGSALSSSEAAPPTHVASTAPETLTVVTHEGTARGARRASRVSRASLTAVDTRPTTTAEPTAVPEPTVAVPPPPVITSPPVVNTPPPPTVIARPVPPPVVHADPARVHVDIGGIQADRVTVTSVDSAMRHVDFTGCYRTEVGELREADGNATLVLDMDEERVARADLVGGAFSAALRQCITQRVIGARVPSADTGGAAAKVTLRFSLR